VRHDSKGPNIGISQKGKKVKVSKKERVIKKVNNHKKKNVKEATKHERKKKEAMKVVEFGQLPVLSGTSRRRFPSIRGKGRRMMLQW
jgi:hypothetical protein